jgi:hypothetical protein
MEYAKQMVLTVPAKNVGMSEKEAVAMAEALRDTTPYVRGASGKRGRPRKAQ